MRGWWRAIETWIRTGSLQFTLSWRRRNKHSSDLVRILNLPCAAVRRFKFLARTGPESGICAGMKNPFPGINPWFEEFWRDVHANLLFTPAIC